MAIVVQFTFQGRRTPQVPPTLTIRPNRPISDLRFTLTAVKMNLRSDIGRFGLIVRVGCPNEVKTRNKMGIRSGLYGIIRGAQTQSVSYPSLVGCEHHDERRCEFNTCTISRSSRSSLNWSCDPFTRVDQTGPAALTELSLVCAAAHPGLNGLQRTPFHSCLPPISPWGLYARTALTARNSRG